MENSFLYLPFLHHLECPLMRVSTMKEHWFIRLKNNIQNLFKDPPLQLLLGFNFIIQPDLAQGDTFSYVTPNESKVRLHLFFLNLPWVITQGRINILSVCFSDLKNFLVRLDIHSYGEDAANPCLLGLLKRFREVSQLLQMS